MVSRTPRLALHAPPQYTLQFCRPRLLLGPTFRDLRRCGIAEERSMRHALVVCTAVGIASALNYYAVTLMIWLGHFLPHRPQSRLRQFHMGGHHALYPDSQHIRTACFLYGKGRQDSLVPMLPWLTLLLSVEWLLLPVRWAAIASIQVVVIAIAHSYVHAQFHLSRARLER